MPTIGEKYGLAAPREGNVTGLREHTYKIASKQLIGIEVEVENVVHNPQLPRGSVWRAESDGSLRNNGMEFVTAPIRAFNAPQVLAQLMESVLTPGCHFSPRTSTHVHLNVQDMDPTQAIDMVLLYAVYEKLFFKFAGRGRIRNIFCVPITETVLLPGLMERGLASAWSKYTGLNLVPIRGSERPDNRVGENAYGTIEFRQMHGTFNVDKLCIWIDLITSLKEYVMRTSTRDIRGMIGTMDEDFDFNRLLNEIFGERAQYLKYDGFGDVKETYLATKSSMLSDKTRARITSAASAESSLYKFKG